MGGAREEESDYGDGSEDGARITNGEDPGDLADDRDGGDSPGDVDEPG